MFMPQLTSGARLGDAIGSANAKGASEELQQPGSLYFAELARSRNRAFVGPVLRASTLLRSDTRVRRCL